LKAPGALAANLDRDGHQRLVTRLTALDAGLHAADPALVDLGFVLERLALGSDHRAAQLLQDQPRRLIAR